MNIEESIKILDKFTTEHKLFNIKHSDEQENSFLKMLYRGTDEFKAIEKLAKEE